MCVIEKEKGSAVEREIVCVVIESVCSRARVCVCVVEREKEREKTCVVVEGVCVRVCALQLSLCLSRSHRGKTH